jgi:hypothetical protein
LFTPILQVIISHGIQIEQHNKNKLIDLVTTILITDFKTFEYKNLSFDMQGISNEIETLFDEFEEKFKISKTSLYDNLNNKLL